MHLIQGGVINLAVRIVPQTCFAAHLAQQLTVGGNIPVPVQTGPAEGSVIGLTLQL